jgi:hypothetical protein
VGALRFTVPSSAAGKVLKVRLAVTLGDVTTTRVTSFRVS